MRPLSLNRCLVIMVWASCLTLAAPTVLFSNSTYPPDEICDNGVDDNGNGLIDLNDPECDCEIIEPVSLIPNPSFEDLNCCPFERSQLDCAVDWIQASEPTTDLIHMCDWMGWINFPPPLPFPDGEGIMGFRDGRFQNQNPRPFWKEYAGACLVSPLKADSTYLFEFDLGFVDQLHSPPINISFFGTFDCGDLPFGVGDDAFGCPTNDPSWVRLGSQWVSGGAGDQWIKVNLEVTPEQDIHAIAIGPDCPAVLTDYSLYYFFDNLLLADINSFELRMQAESHPCRDDFTLSVPYNPDFSYQWYKDGVALPAETDYIISTFYGEGDYQVGIDDGISCRVTAVYPYRISVFSEPLEVTICHDDTYAFGGQTISEPGTYVDTLRSINNCDSIVTLKLEVQGRVADTVQARIFAGEQFNYNGSNLSEEGDYSFTLLSSLDCDSLVQLQLRYFQVYIPNVFSPNYDGLNDEFKLFSEEGFIDHIDLAIYDRWGTEIFFGREWDGTQNGKPVNSGTYVYVCQVRMNNGIVRQFSGSVLVLR